jgi:DNA-directed RNA polymerase specialized sigma24 family protein
MDRLGGPIYREGGSWAGSELQETFLHAWRSRESFHGRAALRAWLYQIATNACLDFLDRHLAAPNEATPGQSRTSRCGRRAMSRAVSAPPRQCAVAGPGACLAVPDRREPRLRR